MALEGSLNCAELTYGDEESNRDAELLGQLSRAKELLRLFRSEKPDTNTFRAIHSILNPRDLDELETIKEAAKYYLNADLTHEMHFFSETLASQNLMQGDMWRTRLKNLQNLWLGFDPHRSAKEINSLLKSAEDLDGIELLLLELMPRQIDQLLETYERLNDKIAHTLVAALKREVKNESRLSQISKLLEGTDPWKAALEIFAQPDKALEVLKGSSREFRERARKVYERRYNKKLLQSVPEGMVHELAASLFGEHALNAAIKLYSTMANYKAELRFDGRELLALIGDVPADERRNMEQVFNELGLFDPRSKDLRDELNKRLSAEESAAILGLIDRPGKYPRA